MTALGRIIDTPVGAIILSADAWGRLTGAQFGDGHAAGASFGADVEPDGGTDRGTVRDADLGTDRGTVRDADLGTDRDADLGADRDAGVGAPASGEAARRVLDDTATQLLEYFGGRRRRFEIPLAMEGSPFQRRVWTLLQQIPFATTVSYGHLAAQLGRPGAARAVGHANARNPVAVIVPCHRVVGSTGRLTGYGGGLTTKQHLLDLEATVAGLSPPSASRAPGSL